jgi:hypothetical protein
MVNGKEVRRKKAQNIIQCMVMKNTDLNDRLVCLFVRSDDSNVVYITVVMIINIIIKAWSGKKIGL